MKDPSGTNQVLIKEISPLKQQIKEQEPSKSERKSPAEGRHKREEYFEAIIQNSSDIILILDKMGSITYASPSTERILGYRPDELIGKRTLDLIMPDDKPRAIADFARALQTKEVSLPNVFHIRHQDGTERILEGIGKNLLSNPIVAGFVINIRDITERKRAEEVSRNIESRYLTLFEQSPNGILLIDTDTGRTIDANETASKQLGYTCEEFSALTVFDYEALESPEETAKHIQKLLHDGIDNFETLHRTKSGEIRNVHVWTRKIQLNDHPFFYAIYQDITDRKRVEQEMVILAEIGRVIGSTLDIDEVYERFATEVNKLITFDRIHLNLIDPDKKNFTLVYVFGSDVAGRKPGDKVPLAQTISETVLRTRTGLLFHYEREDEIDGRFPGALTTFRAGMRSLMCVPLISRNDVIGLLHFRTKKKNAYTEQDLRLAEKIGMQIAGAVANAQLFSDVTQAQQENQQTIESLRRSFGTTVRVMASAVESRDPYTAGHQTRSTDLARAIATEMGLPQEKIDGIRMAGTIHDIGKLSIPAEILSKPTKLTELEFALIKEHARKGFEMIKDVESPWPLAEIVYQHHERMDGSGYPRNLKGEDILIEARTLAVADVVEAMASHRPYRPALGINAALNEIEKNRGIFYDCNVADACLRLFREKGFLLAET